MDKIVLSPKYGWYMNIVCRILCISLIIIMVAISIAILIGVFATGDYKELTKSEIISIVIIAVLVGAVADVPLLLLYIKQLKFEKKIKLWKQDFVKLYAKLLEGFVPENVVGRAFLSISLVFTFEGQEHVIDFHSVLFSRQIKRFSKAGTYIPIYYSPTYDEIVFIKES